MKKLIALFLTFTFLISFTACGEKKSKTDEKGKNDSLQVDEGLIMVDITLPADFFEGETDTEIQEEAKEKKFSKCVINEDGSVTYTMTKARRKELLKEIADGFDESVDEILAGIDGEPAHFSEIKHDKNFTKITMKANEKYEDFDNLMTLGFLFIASEYQILGGVDSEKTDVTVVIEDINTGEELYSISTEELRSESEEESEVIE